MTNHTYLFILVCVAVVTLVFPSHVGATNTAMQLWSQDDDDTANHSLSSYIDLITLCKKVCGNSNGGPQLFLPSLLEIPSRSFEEYFVASMGTSNMSCAKPPDSIPSNSPSVLVIAVNILAFLITVGMLCAAFYMDRSQQSHAKDKIHDEEVRRLKEEIARLRKESESYQASPALSPLRQLSPILGPMDLPPSMRADPPPFNPEIDSSSDDSFCGGKFNKTKNESRTCVSPKVKRSLVVVSPPQSFYFSHFTHSHRIGIGGCGAVYLAEHKTTGINYAVKVMALSARSRDRILTEAATHATLDHPNVVRYYSSWEDSLTPQELKKIDLRIMTRSSTSNMSIESGTTSVASDALSPTSGSSPLRNYLFIQMHFYKNGTLRQWLDAPARVIDAALNIRIFQQLICGLVYLHSRGILHRDLKPGNIFLADNESGNIQTPDIKIGDFGLSIVRERNEGPAGPGGQEYCDDEDCTAGVGTPLYCSPEQMNSGRVSEASDVFGLGMVMLECYMTCATESEKHRVFDAARKGWISPEQHPVARDFKDEVKLVIDMVRHDPNIRMPLAEVQRVVKRLAKKYSNQQVTPPAFVPMPHSPVSPAMAMCRTEARACVMQVVEDSPSFR